jgi:hypothetical protein
MEPIGIGERLIRVHHRIVPVAASMLVSLALTACQQDLPGPCMHISREPIITLTSNEATRLEVSHVRVNGRPVRPVELVAGVAAGVATVAERRVITCQVPCGFGDRPGDWEFRVTSPGQRHTEVHRQAGYAEFDGGCPSYSDGGVVIDVDMASRR